MAADTSKSVADNPGVIAPPPAIALATVLLGVALDWLIPVYVLTVVFYFWTRVVIGVLLIAAGAALALTGERSFRAAQTNVAPWRPALWLVTSGIFARIRNPMYLGLGLIVLGLGFALASDWTLVLLVRPRCFRITAWCGARSDTWKTSSARTTGATRRARRVMDGRG